MRKYTLSFAAASEQAVLSGWAAYVCTQWAMLYRQVHWFNRHKTIA